MKNVICGLVAVAGLAAAANAGTSKLNIEVSKDGINWSNSVSVNQGAGDTGRVLIRYSMSWVPASSDTAVPVAFTSLTFQPVICNPRFGTDVVATFASQGNNTNGGAVDMPAPGADTVDGPFGRIKPFGSTGPAATNAASSGNRYAVITHTNPVASAPGNYYRIARNDITRWMGTTAGPTTGTAAANNFNGAGGVAAVQKGSGLVGPNDPPFRSGIDGVVIMILALDTGTVASGASHTILAQAPTDGMGRNTATGARQASWFSGPADSSGAIKGDVMVMDAEINIVPAPGALALLGLGGLVIGRRRR